MWHRGCRNTLQEDRHVGSDHRSRRHAPADRSGAREAACAADGLGVPAAWGSCGSGGAQRVAEGPLGTRAAGADRRPRRPGSARGARLSGRRLGHGERPADREHRWVRDLAAELLHYADPERYPLMTRWVWDARANTGVIREIWHAEDIDGISLEVPDDYATFLVLREELAQYLAANGVFRDVLFYVDVLMAQVYAGYIGERGGTYLRADFATPEDPMLHTRRILGLDGVNPSGRTKLKALDGRAEIVQ